MAELILPLALISGKQACLEVLAGNMAGSILPQALRVCPIPAAAEGELHLPWPLMKSQHAELKQTHPHAHNVPPPRCPSARTPLLCPPYRYPVFRDLHHSP